MQALLDCNAEVQNVGPLELWFTEQREWITQEDGRLAFVACRAGRDAYYVTCERAWIHEAARTELAYAGAHEVSHIAGDYEEPPLKTMAAGLEKCQ